MGPVMSAVSRCVFTFVDKNSAIATVRNAIVCGFEAPYMLAGNSLCFTHIRFAVSHDGRIFEVKDE
jgi:hypothetical protein